MENSILAELKKELIGDSPDNELIKLITSSPDVRKELLSEASKVKGDTKGHLRYIYLAVINSVLHLKRREIEDIRKIYRLGSDEILELVEVTFILCGNIKKYDIMIFIADNYTIEDRTLVKSLIEMIKALIRNQEYEKAAAEWNKYRQFIVNDRAIYDTLKEEFVKRMTFKSNQKIRDYSIPYKINKLFGLPKDITFQKTMAEYNYNYDERRYYTAASIAKYLRLGDAIMKKAANEGFRLELWKFKKNLQKGIYKNWKKINSNDAFYTMKKVLIEFNLFNLSIKKSDPEYPDVRNIVDRIYDIFIELVEGNAFEQNGTITRTYIAIILIKEYGLNNDLLFPHIVKEVVGHTETLVRNIEKEIVNLKNSREYYDMLQSLRRLNLLDLERTDRIGQKIFMFALEEKEITFAIKVFKDFSFRFEAVAPETLNTIYDWAKNNDFDTIFTVMESFPIKPFLIKNNEFMDKIHDYYKKNMTDNKLLKCLSIAETFEFDRDKYMSSVNDLFETHLKSKDIPEAKKLLKKYKVKRSVVVNNVKKNYYEVMKTDKRYAGKMRTEFDLSVFDVGIFKWLLYEVVGLQSKDEE